MTDTTIVGIQPVQVHLTGVNPTVTQSVQVQPAGVNTPVAKPVQVHPIEDNPTVGGKTYMYDKLATITVDLREHKLSKIKVYINGAYRKLANGDKVITMLEEAKSICKNNSSYLTFEPYTLDGVTHTDARA